MENNNFHNPYNIILDKQTTRILGLGLKFIPRNIPPSTYELFNAFKDYSRQIRIKYFFQGKPQRAFEPRFYIPNPIWQPPLASPDIEFYLKNCHRKIITQLPWWMEHSKWRPSPIFQQLIKLRNNPEYTIRPTDKNLGLIILPTKVYIKLCKEHLDDRNTYQLLDEPYSLIIQARTELSNINETICQHINIQYRRQILKYLNHPITHPITIPPFHVFPKVHKTPLKGRPIAGAVKWISTNLSKILASLLRPYCNRLPHLLKDTKTLIQNLSANPHVAHENTFSMDITSLYPNMIQDDIIRSMDVLIELGATTAFVRDVKIAITFILRYAMIKFDNQHYLQKCGVPMGTNVAVELANIYVYCFVERTPTIITLISTHCKFYKRYIDDIFGTFNGTLTEFENFFTLLNNQHINLSFTGTQPSQTTIFLDLKISSSHNNFMTETYQKLLNRYLYVPAHSIHTKATKQGFIRGEAIRFIRNSSTNIHYGISRLLFITRLKARGYSKAFIDEALKDVHYSKRQQYLLSSTLSTPNLHSDRIFFKTIYHDSIQHLHLGHILNSNLPSSLQFQPILAFKKNKNLGNLLTRSYFSTNLFTAASYNNSSEERPNSRGTSLLFL